MRSSTLKTLSLAAAVFAASTVAGIAYAASERYDSANENIVKAVALLKAIDHADQGPAEKAHRLHAIRQLEGALQQIDKAKAAADKTAADKNKKDKDRKGHKGHDGHKDHKSHKGHKHD